MVKAPLSQAQSSCAGFARNHAWGVQSSRCRGSRGQRVCLHRARGSQPSLITGGVLEMAWNPRALATSLRSGWDSLDWLLKKLSGLGGLKCGQDPYGPLQDHLQDFSRNSGLKPTGTIGSAGRKIRPAPPSLPLPDNHQNVPSPQITLQFMHSPLTLLSGNMN